MAVLSAIESEKSKLGGEETNGSSIGGTKRKPRVSGAFEVDLFESLSHMTFSTQLERLTARDWQLASRSSKKRLQTSRTRRRFAQVGDAVVQVLTDAGCELRMMEIHRAVEGLLGEPVSRSSVKNYLAAGTDRRKTQLFERVSRGRYRLIG
jgi:hypothetical protein